MDRRREWEDRTNELTLYTGKVKAKTNSRAVRETQNKHEKESDGRNKAGETAPMASPLLATHHCFTALLFPAI